MLPKNIHTNDNYVGIGTNLPSGLSGAINNVIYHRWSDGVQWGSSAPPELSVDAPAPDGQESGRMSAGSAAPYCTIPVPEGTTNCTLIYNLLTAASVPVTFTNSYRNCYVGSYARQIDSSSNSTVTLTPGQANWQTNTFGWPAGSSQPWIFLWFGACSNSANRAWAGQWRLYVN